MDKLKMLSREEYEKWYKKIPANECTFCNWQKYQIVLKEFDNWIWIACNAPYWRYHTMILPKRHFVKYSDMSFKEAAELVSIVDYGEKKMLDSKLKRKDGTLIEKVIYFWRFRFNRFDPVSNNIRPDHWHLHLTPDRDHIFDPTLEKDACKVDISILKSL